MCGFVVVKMANGILFNRYEEMKLRSAANMLSHRGPDGTVVKEIDLDIWMAHARLAIIDLNKSSNQPFEVDERYFLVFNGEIYNYIELRRELTELGHNFLSDGDSEVLLRSYIEWGVSCCNKFNGAWAFLIYDKEKKVLFGSRDRFGVKPMYYKKTRRGDMVFSSEIKAIIECDEGIKEPNYNSIAEYCKFSIDAEGAETWFKDVFRIMPGTYFIYENGNLMSKRYWGYKTKKASNKRVNGLDTLAEYYNLFVDSVKIRLRTHVPYGVALSSGIDSLSIAKVVSEVGDDRLFAGSYTSSFKDNDGLTTPRNIYRKDLLKDETEDAEQYAQSLGIRSSFVQTDYSDFCERLKECLYYLESGSASPAIIPFYQLVKKAREDGVKVLLDGQGADELLGGYITLFVIPQFFDLLFSLRFKEALGLLWKSRTYVRLGYSLYILVRLFGYKQGFIRNISMLLKPDKELYCNNLEHSHPVDSGENKEDLIRGFFDRAVVLCHAGNMRSLLHYGDSLSMAHGVEMRNPFLDFRLVEYVLRLPNRWKINQRGIKYIHRNVFISQYSPSSLSGFAKNGYNTPIQKVLTMNEVGEMPLNLLLEERTNKRGLFKKVILEKLIYEQIHGKRDNSNLLFRLISVEMWFRVFID